MKFRKIGDSDLEVSAVALGSWVLGGDCWGKVDDSVSVRVVAEAIDSGINFIDTAPIYGSGRSEIIIGEAIKGKKDVMVATKCGLEKKGRSIRPNLSGEFIRDEIENSLQRLGVERIDLYQCHWPDPDTPLEESFGELKKLITEGKIRYIGVSNFEKELLEEVFKIAPIVSNQMRYSIFDRNIEEDNTPLCAAKGVSILSYGSLGGGILTGKYEEPPVISKSDVRSFFYKYYAEPFWSKAQGVLAVLKNIAEERDVPVAHVAINWVLSHKEVASCIVGSRTPEQIKQSASAADRELSTDEIEKIEKVIPCLF